MSGDTLPLACDLGEPASVRACAATLSSDGTPLDAIICNAGIMALPQLTQVHGYEKQFFTNHIGHFLLVVTLLPVLAGDGRVVVVSSDAHRRAPKEGVQLDNLSGEAGFYFDTSHDQRAGSRFLASLRAGYEAERWSAEAWVHNLFDERYPVRGFYFENEPPDFPTKLYLRWGDPRQAGISFRCAF